MMFFQHSGFLNTPTFGLLDLRVGSTIGSVPALRIVYTTIIGHIREALNCQKVNCRLWPVGRPGRRGFLELWKLLEEAPRDFSFSIQRFNLAFDRRLPADRIVDLIIAAEALFLSDQGKDRGELTFRVALRAAKFVKHPTYSQHDVLRIMRDAYSIRSAIVHGGSPKKIKLPDDASATLGKFILVVEELVRLALRKALSLGQAAKQLGDPEYWDTLILA